MPQRIGSREVWRLVELKIVARDPLRAKALAATMAEFKSRLTVSNLKPSESETFDVFLSFSSQDSEAADFARAELAKGPPRSTYSIFDFRSIRVKAGRRKSIA